ncbi:AEC family transporter [Salinarimonas ramus]|uniref:Malonate transporter n=1 Tax=Salinarimonas ramus TaxID=690164 RepID=A0A917QI46_9HYPH|nr:AEC family transporter [Salinarimonas ramus]GGK50142.1 malonate transporter [Salinarimonas ramus]
MSDLVGLLDLLAPFFGLIALGWACGRFGARPASGLAWMQFFLIYVALPCLFFRLIADKPLSELTNWPFVAVTTLSTYIAFSLAFAVGLAVAREMPQAVMQGVAGAYSNIGYMGPPLVLAALGPEASPPVVLIFVFDSLLLFSLVPFLMAVAGVEKKSLLTTAGEVAFRIVTHPFNVATMIGVAASFLEWTPPSAIDKMTLWLSNAAAPCALFLLGVTVALSPRPKPAPGRPEKRGLRAIPPEVPFLVGIKLVVHPLIVWVLLSLVGDFAAPWVFAAIVMAALPPALNIFVISTQYGVGVERASACVLVGTVASVVTLTGFLWLIETGILPHDLF